MQGYVYEALRELFLQKAIVLREPQFKRLPIKVDLAVLDTNPFVREVIFTLLAYRIDARAYDGVMPAVDDCRALAAIYADRCGLPFVLPMEVTASPSAPVLFYGNMPQQSCLVLLNAYNLPSTVSEFVAHPLVRVLNAAREKRYRVQKAISIFDADRDGYLRRHIASLSGPTVAYEAIFELGEVFRIIGSNPSDFQLSADKVTKAKEHYETQDLFFSKQ